MALWSMAHGLSLLQNQQVFTRLSAATHIADLLRDHAHTFLQGVLAEEALAPPG
ncbi:MAG: hypothetical protein ACK5HY_15970 [Parahaliea sp.]